MERDTITLAGRSWRLSDQTTLWQDVHMMDLARRAGLDSVALGKGQDADALAARILDELLSPKGTGFDMLGIQILPEGVDPSGWTPEIGAATAAMLRNLTAPAEKDRIRGLLISLILGFFESALRSSRRLDTASAEEQTGDVQRVRTAAGSI